MANSIPLPLWHFEAESGRGQWAANDVDQLNLPPGDNNDFYASIIQIRCFHDNVRQFVRIHGLIMPLYVLGLLYSFKCGLTLSSHLLGKKSWNVYNQENIARVRRDEAAARAQEEAEEQRLREIDAEHRFELLRGNNTNAFPRRVEDDLVQELGGDRPRKRRRLPGEDDTERDIRLARGEAARVKERAERHQNARSLIDNRGHINLFGEGDQRRVEKKAVDAEASKARQNSDGQYTMRFSNASGTQPSHEKPWYTESVTQDDHDANASAKDVWGNADPRRREREQQRLRADDPLVAMKRGVAQLREVEKKRKEWRDQRERDLSEVEELAREARKRTQRARSEADSLEDFSLDGGYKSASKHRKTRSAGHESGRRKHRHRRSDRHHS